MENEMNRYSVISFDGYQQTARIVEAYDMQNALANSGFSQSSIVRAEMLMEKAVQIPQVQRMIVKTSQT